MDTFYCDQNQVSSENGNEGLILFSEYDDDNNKSMTDNLPDIDSFDPSKVLYNIRQKHSNRLIITHGILIPLEINFQLFLQ